MVNVVGSVFGRFGTDFCVPEKTCETLVDGEAELLESVLSWSGAGVGVSIERSGIGGSPVGSSFVEDAVRGRVSCGTVIHQLSCWSFITKLDRV